LGQRDEPVVVRGEQKPGIVEKRTKVIESAGKNLGGMRSAPQKPRALRSKL